MVCFLDVQKEEAMQEVNRSGKPAVDERYIRPRKATELMKSAQSIRQTVYLYGAEYFALAEPPIHFMAPPVRGMDPLEVQFTQ